MRRLINALTVLILITQIILMENLSVNAASKSQEVAASLELANKFLKDYYNYSGDYFRKQSFFKKRDLNENWAVKDNGLSAFYNLPVFIYGDIKEGAEEGSKYGNDRRRYDEATKQWRALGFSIVDRLFDTHQIFPSCKILLIIHAEKKIF